MVLPFTKEDIILYFNLGIIAIIALFALIGFLRGTFKSIYYMIATIIVFVGGWFLADVVCNMLLDVDLSMITDSITIQEKTYEMTTAREMLSVAVSDLLFAGNMPEDSLVLATILAIVTMIFRIGYFFLLVLLSFTLFKLFFDIIWLIIKPRRKTPEGKKKKAGMLSRLGGLGIGAVKGLLYTLLFCFIIAGITSVVTTMVELQDQANDTTDTYSVIIIDDTATLVRISNDENSGNSGSQIDDMLEEYGDIINMLGFYSETIPGKVFGSIKIGEDGLDEYVFDGLFNIKIETETDTHDIKLRKELKHVANALIKVSGLLNGEFSMETLATMDKEVLSEVIDELTSLELVNVLIPAGIELLLANDKYIDDAISNEALRTAVRTALGDMKGIDYNAEFKEIGYVFVDVVQILQFGEDGELNIDFLSFDPDTIESIFEKLGKLGLVDIVAPVFVEYLFSLESFQEAFAELEINLDEIIHPEKYDPNEQAIKWSDEIANIGRVYKAFSGLGLTTEDFEEMKFTFTDENIAAVDNLVDTIFNSRVISKAVPVLVSVGKKKMPEEYASIVNIPDEVNWGNELKPLLKSALVLFSSGLFSGDEEMTTKLSALTDEKIDQLALYLSQSSIIKTNLNGLIDKFLASDGESDGVFGDIALTALDSPDDWTQTEISSIFKAVKLIIDTDIIGSDDIFKSFSELEDETITSLATYLSSSKFICKNLSAILTYFLDQLSNDEEGLELVSLEEEEWTETELSSIFLALKDIAGSGILNSEGTEGIEALSDETIDNLGTHISSSKFLTKNLTAIMDMLLESASESLGEGVEIKGFENAEDWTKLEIVSLLKSARLIVSYSDDITQIINITEDELDTLMGSKLITNTLVSFIKAYAAPGKTLEIVKGVDMVSDDEWKDTDTLTTFTLAGKVLTINPASGADKYYIYVDGEKVASTEALSFDFATLEDVNPTSENVKVVAKENGEIRKMFVSIQTLVGDDFNSETLSDDIINSITDLTEAKIIKIIDSKIISETIICKIEEFAEGDDAFISIPEGDLTKVNLDGSKDRTAWNENGTVHGELFKLLRAVTVVFSGQNIGADDFSFSTDLITNIDSSDIYKITESIIINETIIQKIEDMANEDSATIYIPVELQATPTTIDRDKWIEANETYNLLNALTKVFSGGTVDTSNLKIKPIVDEKDEILKSLIIDETIKRQIVKDGTGIIVPTELDQDTLDGWKNTYDEDGNVTSKGEISALLGAISLILNLSDSTNIDEISTDNLKLYNIIDEENQDEILKSLVITATVKDKVSSFDGISEVPEEVTTLSKTTLDGWKNTYNPLTGEVTSRGEVAALLTAVGIVLNITEETNLDSDLNANSINLNTVINRKDEILKSVVITATVKDKITDGASTSGIVIPTDNDLSTKFAPWSNTYNAAGDCTGHGEIAYLLDAVKIILNIDSESETTIDNFNTDSINLNTVITSQDTILKSLVITATVKDKITSIGDITVPTEEELSTTDLTGWKNTYTAGGEVESRGEIAALLTAVKIALGIDSESTTTIDNINTSDIKLNTIVSNQDEILKSLVITATVKDKITGIGDITVPTEEELSTTDLTGWKNTYNASGNVTSRGEISALLTAVKLALGIDSESTTTIDNFNASDIKLNTIVDNKDTILKSLVITATVKDKITSIGDITIPTDESLSATNLTGWKNTYNAGGEVTSRGEISALLTAVKLALGIDSESTTTIDSFSAGDIKLGTIIASQDEILKSLVITATIKDKVSSFDGISEVPEEEESLSKTNLTGWKNTYSALGEVESRGEVAALLTAVGIVFNVTSETNLDSDLNADSINLNTVITRKDEILRSIVITATVKDKITSDTASSGIVIPTDNNLSTQFAPWKNTYNGEEVATRGEISYLLDAVKIILNIDSESDTTINNIRTDDIKLNTVVARQDDILKSLVITATIKDKIESIDSISIPEGENLSTTNLDGWKNTYTSVGLIATRGEISALLNAINIILSIDEDTRIDNFSADSIKLGKVVYEKDVILKSLIISDTIREKIVGNGTLEIPAELNGEGLTGWKSTYEDGSVVAYGEIARLLDSIKYALNISQDDESNFNTINVDNITVNNLVTNRQIILHSSIISETIKAQVLSNASDDDSKILRLPATYAVSESPNYISWLDTYVDTTYNDVKKEFNFNVTSVGELDKLLAAIGELLDDSEVTFNNISTFNYSNLFEPTAQAKLISSKLISETIIQKINENALSIPNDPTLRLNVNADRTAWWNATNGELKYFLNAIGQILDADEKEALNVNLSVNTVYAKITNEAIREELFKSYLIVETLTVNFKNLDLFSSTLPTYENSGIDLNALHTDGSDNRDDWYMIDNTLEERSITEKELWRLITSIHILLGDDFDTEVEFSIDQVLDNDDLKPNLDANKVNLNNTVGDLLESKIIEETFKGVVVSLITGDGYLADYLNVPADPNWYAYTTPEGEEYDTRTIIESIYQMQNHADGKTSISYRTVSTLASANSLESIITLRDTIQNLDTAALADAFVVSRTFHDSIEKFFNGAFGSIYTTEYSYIGAFVGMQPWNDVRLHQANYAYIDLANPNKADVSATLKDDIDTIITNIKKAFV